MSSLFDRSPPTEPSRANGFSGNRLHRLSEARPQDAVARALAQPASRLHLFLGDRLLLDFANGATRAFFGEAEARSLGLCADTLILLGTTGNAARLAAQVDEATALPASVKAIDLRSLAIQGLIDGEALGAVAQARSLLAWHANHPFCARCGARTEMRGGGVRRVCPSCGAEHFPRVDPVVIMLAVDGDRCLLGRQARFQPGMYSCLAGFVEPGETIEDAVRRETREEAGIEIGRVAYHSSQPWPFPSSLMIGCHAEALSFALTPDETELEDCRWFARDEVRAMMEGRHEGGLGVPPRMAIANRLIDAFLEAEG